ncbi:hypothetical protein LPB136_06775 [Tenacibaculum todarodis]|uniref:Lipocalin-like domain-containing protein n=1 Tax=Tenacibaculum todarodis TaxID=1850252 RepID=A0A1L3JIY7_9FLAO|nr:DUF6265 family protein [Tenacibaculum todarodis]APG65069.1 hypothetical protein LPB136_06775 [Tenacibaculum todarodis]
MKTFCSILILLFLLNSCQTETKQNYPDFLLGKWQRTNDELGKTTFENWEDNYTGIGFTLKKNDTVFKETLSIISKNDTLHLKVEGVNEQPTLFKFTEQTDSSFVCENPQNEFPTKIEYWLENKQLKAKVSNDEFDVEFVFERME